MEKISVIVPVYKAERWLPACMESILNQTYRNTEVILVDDGSTDNSGVLCDAYAEHDPRVKVIHQENQGASLARGNGVKAATGDYIAFIDADDEPRADMLEKLLRLCIEKDCEVAQCATVAVGVDVPLPEISCSGEIRKYTGREISELFFDYEHGGHHGAAGVVNKLAARRLYDDIVFHPLTIAEDEDVVYQLYWYAKSLAVTDEVLYYIRQTPDSVSRSGYTLKQADHLTMLEGQAAFYREKGAPTLEGKALLDLCFAIQSKLMRMRELIPEESRELRKYWSAHRWWVLKKIWHSQAICIGKKCSATLQTVAPRLWYVLKK